MTDDLENALITELRLRAESDTPPAPVELLVRKGHGLRRRRRMVRVTCTSLVVAAAVALVAIAGVSLTRSGDQMQPSPLATPSPVPLPGSIEDLPHGNPPEVPFLRDGALHVGPRTIRTNANMVEAAGPTVLVGHYDGDSPTRRWQLLDGDQLVAEPALDDVIDPVLSPKGSVAAWTSYPDRRTTRITAWDPSTGQEISHLDLEAPFEMASGGGQQVEVLGIDQTGLIYYSYVRPRGPQVHVWRPREGTSMPLLGGENVMGIGPLGPVLQRGQGLFDVSGTYGSVGADGTFHARGHIPTDQDGAWATDGSWFAYLGDGSGNVQAKVGPTTAWVLDISNGRKSRLQLPASPRPGVLIAESNATVLISLPAGGYRQDIVRCFVSDGHCELSVSRADPDEWRFPGSFL